MSDINVISKTQKIIVDAASSTASVINIGPQGPTGATGTAGANGKTILNGTVVPATGTGVDGDFYIDTVAKLIYGPKTAGAWGSGTSIVGGSFGTYTAWTPTGVTWSVGNGTWSAFYARVNNLVHIYGTFTWGSTSSITGSLLIGGLPVNIDSAMISSGGYGADFMIGNATFQTTGAGGSSPYLGLVASNTATQLRLWVSNASGTYARSTSTTATVPFTWATGDTFRFSAFYEAA